MEQQQQQQEQTYQFGTAQLGELSTALQQAVKRLKPAGQEEEEISFDDQRSNVLWQEYNLYYAYPGDPQGTQNPKNVREILGTNHVWLGTKNDYNIAQNPFEPMNTTRMALPVSVYGPGYYRYDNFPQPTQDEQSIYNQQRLVGNIHVGEGPRNPADLVRFFYELDRCDIMQLLALGSEHEYKFDRRNKRDTMPSKFTFYFRQFKPDSIEYYYDPITGIRTGKFATIDQDTYTFTQTSDTKFYDGQASVTVESRVDKKKSSEQIKCYQLTVTLNIPGKNPKTRELEVLHLPKIADMSIVKNFTDSDWETIFDYFEKNPTLIHCSAGLGRSGLFAVAYLAMKRGIFDTKKSPKKIIDELNNLLFNELRLIRPGLVQTQEQYQQIYLIGCIFKQIQLYRSLHQSLTGDGNVGSTSRTVSHATLLANPASKTKLINKLTDAGFIEKLTSYVNSHDNASHRHYFAKQLLALAQQLQEKTQASEQDPIAQTMLILIKQYLEDERSSYAGRSLLGQIKTGLTDAKSNISAVTSGNPQDVKVRKPTLHAVGDLTPILLAVLLGEDAPGADKLNSAQATTKIDRILPTIQSVLQTFTFMQNIHKTLAQTASELHRHIIAKTFEQGAHTEKLEKAYTVAHAAIQLISAGNQPEQLDFIPFILTVVDTIKEANAIGGSVHSKVLGNTLTENLFKLVKDVLDLIKNDTEQTLNLVKVESLLMLLFTEEGLSTNGVVTYAGANSLRAIIGADQVKKFISDNAATFQAVFNGLVVNVPDTQADHMIGLEKCRVAFNELIFENPQKQKYQVETSFYAYMNPQPNRVSSKELGGSMMSVFGNESNLAASTPAAEQQSDSHYNPGGG